MLLILKKRLSNLRMSKRKNLSQTALAKRRIKKSESFSHDPDFELFIDVLCERKSCLYFFFIICCLDTFVDT